MLSDGAAVFIRPIRPEDEQLYERFMAVESLEDLRWRFFAPVKELDPALITRLTHIDYDRAMAFIALDERTGDMLGVARLHQTVPNETGEFAVIVRSDLKSHGLGWHLMQTLIDYARKRGLRSVQGQVMHDNRTDARHVRRTGFRDRNRSERTFALQCEARALIAPVADAGKSGEMRSEILHDDERISGESYDLSMRWSASRCCRPVRFGYAGETASAARIAHCRAAVDLPYEGHSAHRMGAQHPGCGGTALLHHVPEFQGHVREVRVRLVQLGGLEPPTSCSTDRRSNQLSYSCTGSPPQAAGNYE